ncbi:hypothetical protein [uncultured Clostridium sp.]|jgi:hypothetical protein|uniref:hypothetical protein n=1 Tax=uncultured Clostridium sp. TaxID=59620 RepID=UPI0026336D1D|nr:hypothetical protein [uncultured Clostridium sp.]
MFEYFNDKQIKINLIDATLGFLSILGLILGALYDVNAIPIYISLGVGFLGLAVLNHFAHDLLGKRIFLYGLNFIPFLILLYSKNFDLASIILYSVCAFLSDYVYKKFIEPK